MVFQSLVAPPSRRYVNIPCCCYPNPTLSELGFKIREKQINVIVLPGPLREEHGFNVIALPGGREPFGSWLPVGAFLVAGARGPGPSARAQVQGPGPGPGPSGVTLIPREVASDVSSGANDSDL